MLRVNSALPSKGCFHSGRWGETVWLLEYEFCSTFITDPGWQEAMQRERKEEPWREERGRQQENQRWLVFLSCVNIWLMSSAPLTLKSPHITNGTLKLRAPPHAERTHAISDEVKNSPSVLRYIRVKQPKQRRIPQV